jgi:hypothetical protein
MKTTVISYRWLRDESALPQANRLGPEQRFLLCLRTRQELKNCEGLLTVPNQRSIAPHPYTGVRIQSTLSPWAGCSSGALSLNGAVGLAHSPGQNLKGQGAPTKASGALPFRPSLLI